MNILQKSNIFQGQVMRRTTRGGFYFGKRSLGRFKRRMRSHCCLGHSQKQDHIKEENEKGEIIDK